MEISLANLARRGSLAPSKDCLLWLEQDSGADRVRRIFYDRIASVAVWRVIPWGRLAIFTFIFVLPGVGVLMIDEDFAKVFGGVLLAIGLVADIRYLYCQKTVMAIERDGEVRRFNMVVRPGKLKAFMDELCAQIRVVQRRNVIEPAAEVMETPVAPPETPA